MSHDEYGLLENLPVLRSNYAWERGRLRGAEQVSLFQG